MVIRAAGIVLREAGNGPKPGRFKAAFTVRAPKIFVTELQTLTALDQSGQLGLKGLALTVLCDAPDADTAKLEATKTAERFCRMLSLRTGQFFSVRFSALERADGTPGGTILAPLLHMWREIEYDFSQLASDASGALEEALHEHARVDKATDYFQRGLFYSQQIYVMEGAERDTTRGAFYATDAFNNFYKAIALLIGHPIYKPIAQVLKTDSLLRTRIEKIYDVRDDEGVGHPTLAWEALEGRMQHAEAVARDVLDCYVACLRSGAIIPDPPPKTGRSRRRK